MNKAYRFRLYPNKKQKEFFAKNFGCARFIYNHMLADKISYYNETGKMLKNTPAQYKDEFPWLREADAYALCNEQIHLQSAYNNFFNNKKFGFPKFHKKTNHLTYTTNNCYNSIRITDNKKIKLPKVGYINIRVHRPVEGAIKSVTISKVPSGKYYASILVECDEPEKLPVLNTKVGIDLGLKEFAITSDGEMIENPRYLRKSEKRLKKLQKDLSRKKKGSRNREKARIKLAKQHEKIANQRKDFLHKASKMLIDENQIICIEDLKVKNMINNHYLAKSITDASWSEFARILEYKSKWYGRDLVKIDAWYPSSQLCSVCGERTSQTKSLSVREWTCPHCGTHHERDVNAAMNILIAGTARIA